MKQIVDAFKYEGIKWSVISQSEPFGFRPESIGLKPAFAHPMCENGFWCEYKVEDGQLYMANLYIHTADDKYPVTNGIEMTTENKLFGHFKYNGLNIPMDYTGNIQIVKELWQSVIASTGANGLGFGEELVSLRFVDGKLS